jgi:DNA-binding NarL/FixJ family response regulator
MGAKPHVRKQGARVLIVDDHPLMREGLRARISSQSDLEVCGEAADVQSALDQVKAVSPHLVIVDVALTDSHGLDLIKEVHSRHPQIKMLVLSAYDESLFAERSLRAGAHGYINKAECQDKILDAIRAVLEGRRYVSDDMTQRLVSQAVGGNDATKADPVARLSNRELEVFRLIGQGLTTGAIAGKLHLSVHTIESHREKIRRKIGLKSGNELMKCAVQWVLENA